MGKRVRKRFAHQMPLQSLHQRLQQLAAHEQADRSGDNQIQFRQEGNHYLLGGRYSGFSVQGKITLEEQSLTIEIELPMLAGLFQGKVERYIQEQAKQLLG